MQVLLLPRLKKHGVKQILNEVNKSELFANTFQFGAATAYKDLTSYAASGGVKSEVYSLEISNELHKIAQKVGFPTSTDKLSKSKFDQKASIYLSNLEYLKTGEAFRDDMWAFVTTIVVPDIVAWRFVDMPFERFAGGTRNTLQRLWLRGKILDRGEFHTDRWGLIYNLTEDAMVQIFERPSIASNPELAKAIAEEWCKRSIALGKSRMEDIMRNAIKILRIKNQIISLAYLPPKEIKIFIAEIFDIAVDNISNR
ncbi:hypothetical protein BJ925_2418 [Rahnella aquatilis]|jgi:hypothetical protein|nr:hypothetical protein BJ925_2418 [Rahnella aquatilis]